MYGVMKIQKNLFWEALVGTGMSSDEQKSVKT
jgi:hypothetical protein